MDISEVTIYFWILHNKKQNDKEQVVLIWYKKGTRKLEKKEKSIKVEQTAEKKTWSDTFLHSCVALDNVEERTLKTALISMMLCERWIVAMEMNPAQNENKTNTTGDFWHNLICSPLPVLFTQFKILNSTRLTRQTGWQQAKERRECTTCEINDRWSCKLCRHDVDCHEQFVCLDFRCVVQRDNVFWHRNKSLTRAMTN